MKQKCKRKQEACKKVERFRKRPFKKAVFRKRRVSKRKAKAGNQAHLALSSFFSLYLAKSRFQPIFAAQIYLFICTAKSV